MQQVRARVRFSTINTTKNDTVSVHHAATGAQVAPSLWGPETGARVGDWFPIEDEIGVDIVWRTDSALPKLAIGVSIDSYEYQRFESGVAAPSWIPLRLPGQYLDAETGLHENVNRFYAPRFGRYLSPDPLDEGVHGMPLAINAFAYADSNPITHFDSLGELVKNYLAIRARFQASSIALEELDELHARDTVYEFIFAAPPDVRHQVTSNDWGWTDGRRTAQTNLMKIYINEPKINQPGVATRLEEVAAHEMKHALSWNPGWEAKYNNLAAINEPLALEISTRVRLYDLGVGINGKWIAEHPNVSKYQSSSHDLNNIVREVTNL